MNQQTQSESESEEKPRLGALQVLFSTLAAGLGVQSSKNRERDFKQGKLSTFIIAGLLFTLIFIGVLYTVVSLVLKNVA